MEISELIAPPVPEIALISGGLLAVIIGVIGESHRTYADEVAVFIAFFVGLFMLALGVLTYLYGDRQMSTVLVLGVLGFALFSRGFRKVKWAVIVSLLVAGGVGYGLHLAVEALSITFLSTEIILVVAFVVFIILFLILKAIEGTLRLAGAAVSFRPILFLGGLVAIAEGVLLYLDTSLSHLFG
ncbi:MAG: hypothetical protein ACLFUV_04320 [Methanomassiliicoccales archaeon]